MPRFRAAPVALALAAAACSPTFNWREVRVEPTRLKAMLPCKPERGSRKVAMAGREVELAVTGCDAGGATFAILQADLGDPARASDAIGQWNRATLLNMKAAPATPRAWSLPGASEGAQRVSAGGQRGDGTPVRGEMAYFADGSRVFQAVVYAPEIRAEWTQPFFEGLRLQ